jgi:UDP-N-acetylglucosamine--N-acetylmuramyl-(pentapeptide) pyrophosphoryl-undecaprenol N-acetylglucosamine transferase
VAIIEELQKRDPRLVIQWIGRKSGIEQQVAERVGVPFRGVPVQGWPRKRSIRQAWVAGKLLLGVARSMMYIKSFRPQVVVGVGGYVCLPLCYAAQRMGIPTVLHEQNKRLGMANRLLASRAARLLLSYPDTIGNYPKDKARVVGNPVRAGFASPPVKEAAREAMGLDVNTPVVLVCGGSQGARSINAAVTDAIGRFACDEVQFIWMTGNSDFQSARIAASKAPCKVDVYPFINDMVTACSAADFIVGRSGASTTAELAMLGKPSLLIPYPLATDNHQEQNARAFEAVGGALVVLDGECAGARLTEEIKKILSNPTKLVEMGKGAASLARPGAAEAIVEEILLLAFELKE